MFVADQDQVLAREYASKKRVFGCLPIREFLLCIQGGADLAIQIRFHWRQGSISYLVHM